MSNPIYYVITCPNFSNDADIITQADLDALCAQMRNTPSIDLATFAKARPLADVLAEGITDTEKEHLKVSAQTYDGVNGNMDIWDMVVGAVQ